MNTLQKLEQSIDRDPLARRLSILDVGPAPVVNMGTAAVHARHARMAAPQWRLAIGLAVLAILALAAPVAATSGAVMIQALHQVNVTVQHKFGVGPKPVVPVTPRALPRVTPVATPHAPSPSGDAANA